MTHKFGLVFVLFPRETQVALRVSSRVSSLGSVASPTGKRTRRFPNGSYNHRRAKIKCSQRLLRLSIVLYSCVLKSGQSIMFYNVQNNVFVCNSKLLQVLILSVPCATGFCSCGLSQVHTGRVTCCVPVEESETTSTALNRLSTRVFRVNTAQDTFVQFHCGGRWLRTYHLFMIL